MWLHIPQKVIYKTSHSGSCLEIWSQWNMAFFQFGPLKYFTVSTMWTHQLVTPASNNIPGIALGHSQDDCIIYLFIFQDFGLHSNLTPYLTTYFLIWEQLP